jgi:hypothetical protein
MMEGKSGTHDTATAGAGEAVAVGAGALTGTLIQKNYKHIKLAKVVQISEWTTNFAILQLNST